MLECGIERKFRKLFTNLTFITSLTLVTLLASCSHMRKGDGPPDYDVDVSHIKNPVPKVEPMAKYGNMSSYRVLGKRYYTMKSANAFVQTGTASWYGTQFHAKRTSSGEPYNMLAMTAAHKTLPLPTYVEVTNLKNHRKIIVKVNDRGPFSSNRIIDLSYVAAKKLGMLGHGTAPVTIKAINPRLYAENSAATSSQPTHAAATTKIIKKQLAGANASVNVYLQAGAFASKNNAIKLKQRLASMQDFPVNIALPAVNSKLYRVHIGPILDSASADRITQRLKSIGISTKKITGS